MFKDKEKEIVGDKLRKALVVVWLANKYDKNIQTAKLRKIIGYDTSGLYSARETGWFKEEEGRLVLTEKAGLYLQENLLLPHIITRRLLSYIAIFPLLNFIQWILLNYFNILLFADPLASLASIALLVLFILNWYRIYWWVLKRKKG